MVVFVESFLSTYECDFFINYYNTESDEPIIKGPNHYAKSLIPIQKNTPLRTNILSDIKYDILRIHKYDDECIQSDTYHTHQHSYNLIIYLNDTFTNGRLFFKNGIVVTPKLGMLVYFNRNEPHMIESCIGDRYALVGFSNQDMFSYINKKSLL